MKNALWYILGGIILLIAIATSLYGILSHQEPGYMKVCWKDGRAIYHTSGCPHDLKWQRNQMPLTYYVNLDKDHLPYQSAIDAGFTLWNHQLGCAVFKKVTAPHLARIIVAWGSVNGTAAGSTQHYGKDGPERADVLLINPSDQHAVYRYAAHEAGHVLGLDHDTARRSIMFPFQPDVTDELQFVLPSDADRALLKQLCPP